MKRNSAHLGTTIGVLAAGLVQIFAPSTVRWWIDGAVVFLIIVLVMVARKRRTRSDLERS
jgi:uncharacterized membrane protein YccC